LLLAGALADWWGVSPVLIAVAVAILVGALWGAFQTMRSGPPARGEYGTR